MSTDLDQILDAYMSEGVQNSDEIKLSRDEYEALQSAKRRQEALERFANQQAQPAQQTAANLSKDDVANVVREQFLQMQQMQMQQQAQAHLAKLVSEKPHMKDKAQTVWGLARSYAEAELSQNPNLPIDTVGLLNRAFSEVLAITPEVKASTELLNHDVSPAQSVPPKQDSPSVDIDKFNSMSDAEVQEAFLKMAQEGQ